MVETTAIIDFLKDLASSSPAPGGGSVAALSGSMGAALVSMVANLTKGKTKYAEYQELAGSSALKAEGLMRELLQCTNDDMTAFDGVMSALKMPKDDPGRARALQEAYKSATTAPERTAQKCLEVMRLSYSLVGKSNRTAACDLSAAALQAHAGIVSALENVSVNLRSIHDTQYTADMSSWSESVLREADELLSATIEGVRECQL